ncbi:hypothetical protein DFH07DRAFT_572661 [Mycena maculata]|uniref:MARVEL domain-containing protein n=1 Tax=Mycena maculata TaxID=230809 RepID=A0AAD7IQD2_9AGAR|nr:hypothetical protein DFH07DRAFT_572661 [Mycena maculata]
MNHCLAVLARKESHKMLGSGEMQHKLPPILPSNQNDMVSRVFPLIRLGVLSTAIVFSLITLGLAAALMATSISDLDDIFDLGGTFTYASLAIATSVITLTTIGAMIAIEMVQPGGIMSMISVEISWLTFLWILWLSTGAEAAQASTAFNLAGWVGCGSNSADQVDFEDQVDDSLTTGICSKTSAIEAFGFLTWILLMGYTFTLIFMSLVAANRKHTGVWKSSVANAPFGIPASDSAAYGGAGKPAAAYGTSGSVKTGAVQV